MELCDIVNFDTNVTSELFEKFDIPESRQAKAVNLIGLNAIEEREITGLDLSSSLVRDTDSTAGAIYMHGFERIASFGIFSPLEIGQGSKQEYPPTDKVVRESTG
jgi:hypothetical protein